MSNELLFLLSALIDVLFVFFAARRGIDWLFGTIITNLVLIGVFVGVPFLYVDKYIENKKT